MNKNIIFNTALILLASAAISTAEPFPDIPSNQWAYEAINEMVQKGYIQGFPDGEFKGNLNASRYHLALLLSRILASLEQRGFDTVTKEDFESLEKLCNEFEDDLSRIGIKVTDIEKDMQKVKEEVSGLRIEADGIKDTLKNGSLDKVKLSGDVLVRNYGLVHNLGSLNNVDYGKDHRHRTETSLRLQLDADIDENVSARARWNIIGNNGLNEWDGNNKATVDVEIAYLKVNDMFNLGGDFKFGRDWFQHGHGFVVYNYMDAVNYTRKVGDVDLAFNIFFDRQQNKDYFNIWNINADYNYKGHNLYLGLYYNDRAYDELGNRIVDVNGNPDKNQEIRVELGSYGKLTQKLDKFSYDLAAVISKIENGNGPNEDAEGLLGHVALKYDANKQLTVKFSYTYANDESNANINVDNFNDYCMGDQTIFEDLYLAGMANNDNTNQPFQNLHDYKLEIGYTLDDDRHHFRLAYDYLENDYQLKQNNFNRIFSPIMSAAMGNPFVYYVEDVKANIITFNYTYRLNKDTRLKLCYQNMKVEAKDVPEQNVDLYFTELYSRF